MGSRKIFLLWEMKVFKEKSPANVKVTRVNKKITRQYLGHKRTIDLIHIH